jgi:hypothetical protein
MMCLLIRSPRFVSTRNGINLNHRIDYTFAPVRVHTKRNQFKSIPTYPSQLKLAQVFRLQEDHCLAVILSISEIYPDLSGGSLMPWFVSARNTLFRFVETRTGAKEKPGAAYGRPRVGQIMNQKKRVTQNR